VDATLQAVPCRAADELETILEDDRRAREAARGFLG